MTRRKPMTEAKRVKIFDRHHGICHLCGLPIDYLHEAWHVEHPKAFWLNGADDESNMKPAHRDCHSRKTRDEAPVRAKSNRVRARHLGAHKPRTDHAGVEGQQVQTAKWTAQWKSGGHDD